MAKEFDYHQRPWSRKITDKEWNRILPKSGRKSKWELSRVKPRKTY